MKTMKATFTFFALAFVPAICCLPFGENDLDNVNFIGKGTNEIATALLQGYVAKEDNMVYSPFGFSAILAIFSEGARGPSRDEIATALHFPNDLEAVRTGYKNILQRFVEKKYSNSPEFKNWFYIYKNYTVDEELQNVLRKYYLTEVKYVDRPEDYLKETEIEAVAGKSKDKKSSSDERRNQAPIEKFEGGGNPEGENENGVNETKESENSDKSSPPSTGNFPPTAANETYVKDSLDADAKMKKNETDDVKVEVKFDADADVKTIAETLKVREKEVPEESEGKNVEKKTDGEEKEEKEKPEEMKPLKADVQMGMMPLEHFSGMTDSSIKVKGKESKSQMIIFNGLYYKGEWKTAFERQPAHVSRVFYKSEKEKVAVSTIHSQGIFKAGDILNLDCRAIELPYEGDRYSLLILVPTARNGLPKLISDLAGYPLSRIYSQLSEKLVDVCLPCFEINTISKPISSLRKLGITNVTSIFNPDTADLSGISAADSGLYVEELVQMVTFKVSAEYSKANFLTASVAASRSDVQKFQINQPFLFYLRDTAEDLTIVNGKVVDPTPKPDFYFS